MNTLKVRELAIDSTCTTFWEKNLVSVELLPCECGQVVTGVHGLNNEEMTNVTISVFPGQLNILYLFNLQFPGKQKRIILTKMQFKYKVFWACFSFIITNT